MAPPFRISAQTVLHTQCCTHTLEGRSSCETPGQLTTCIMSQSHTAAFTPTSEDTSGLDADILVASTLLYHMKRILKCDPQLRGRNVYRRKYRIMHITLPAYRVSRRFVQSKSVQVRKYGRTAHRRDSKVESSGATTVRSYVKLTYPEMSRVIAAFRDATAHSFHVQMIRFYTSYSSHRCELSWLDPNDAFCVKAGNCTTNTFAHACGFGVACPLGRQCTKDFPIVLRR